MVMVMAEGLIFDVQRYSIHDGPGIRTTVFFKGCPLTCPWCSNPESQSFAVETMGGRTVGRKVSADEVVKEVLRDKVFFDRSGGGITLSGGEPLAQPRFASHIMEKCKEAGINVCVETSGYAIWDVAQPLFARSDYILYDVKLLDPEKHRTLMGVDNAIMLQNLKRLASWHQGLQVRITVVPGINLDVESLVEVAAFCREIGISNMQWLPYHRLGMHKYEELGREYQLPHTLPPGRTELLQLADEVSRKCRINIQV